MKMLMSHPVPAIPVAVGAPHAPAPAVATLPVDPEVALDDAFGAELSTLDDSFRVQDESGIDEALLLLGNRVTAEKARVLTLYGDAGREALADARALFRVGVQMADQRPGARV
jgi:hypothetical protein